MAIEDSSNRSFSRPIIEDRVQYYVIGQRSSLVDYEIPELLISPCLDLINLMPKSISQILDPLVWYRQNLKNGTSPHVYFSILFDDYPLEDYDFYFKVPTKMLVIFLNVWNNQIFQKLESLDRVFLISSDKAEIYSKIKSSERLKLKTFRGYNNLFRKLLRFALNEYNLEAKEFLKIKEKVNERAKEMLQEYEFKKIPNFKPCTPNILNLSQILSLDIYSLFEQEVVNVEKRSETLIETSIVLGGLSQWLKFYDRDNIPDNAPRPTLIFSYPYFNPDHRELFEKVSKESNTNNRSLIKQFRYFRFLEQDIDTYNYNYESESNNSKIASELFLSTAAIKVNQSVFLDFVGYLHSTFESSPFIRVPARGASLNSYVSRLSPSQYRNTQNANSFSKNIYEIGKALADNLPSEILMFIEDYVDGIFGISDLPLEWLLVKETPLSFLCDVCRIPESSPTSILAQFNRNCCEMFLVQKDLLNRTLVVCGATEKDSIFETYQHHTKLKKNDRNLVYNTAHIQSKTEFFEVVNRLHPHLLIIDSHGDFKKKDEGSYISFGNEKVTGDDIIKHLPQIPLVILSCCWGTPIYGNSNTIAQAFFEKGSFSVLSTFLPISVNRGFTLYFRILKNLSYALTHPIHESWMNFVSHNIRTSYFDDILTTISEKFGSNVLDQEKYIKLRFVWQLQCMKPEMRYGAYKDSSKIVLACIKDNYKSRVERFLSFNKLIPEFMFYTHLGRGDLIKFNSWVQENKAHKIDVTTLDLMR